MTMLGRVEERPGKHKFIHEFHANPGMVCPSFSVLSWANGCPYNCEYCYLQYTLRFQQPKMVVWTNYDLMQRQVKKWVESGTVEEYLNAGELSDSLALGKYSALMLDTITPVLREGRGVFLLTKSMAQVMMLRQAKPFIIAGFSVNAPAVANLFEHPAPTSLERLFAAETLGDRGWRVRLRIDPLIPIEGWEEQYGKLCAQIRVLHPERVTLGSLRFHPGLPARRQSEVWKYSSNRIVGGKKRLNSGVALEMYKFILERLDLDKTQVALCKESTAMWDELRQLNLLSQNERCVCVA